MKCNTWLKWVNKVYQLLYTNQLINKQIESIAWLSININWLIFDYFIYTVPKWPDTFKNLSAFESAKNKRYFVSRLNDPLC